jgi:hypothetical protein
MTILHSSKTYKKHAEHVQFELFTGIMCFFDCFSYRSLYYLDLFTSKFVVFKDTAHAHSIALKKLFSFSLSKSNL